MSIPRAPTRGTRRRRLRTRSHSLRKYGFVALVGSMLGTLILVSLYQSSRFSNSRRMNHLPRNDEQTSSTTKPLTGKNSIEDKSDSLSAQDNAVQKLKKAVSSKPPPSVSLDDTNTRHLCLADIRKIHETKLRPFLKDSEKVLLVDPAYHSNVGDHMITVAEQAFLNDPLECGYNQANGYADPCDSVLSKQQQSSTTAVWHGGGNWGDLWRGAQEPRIDSFATLLKADVEKILTMPNSWFYQNPALQKADIQAILDTVGQSNMDRMVFCWREQSSYEHSMLYFAQATNLLVPDIAFQLGPYTALHNANDPHSDLLVLLRDDHESIYQEYRNRRAFRQILESVPGASDLSYSIVDWKDRLTRFGNPDIFFTETAVQLLGSGKVVICDRLHAAILAYLCDLPFVYLDQISGKIHKTFSVAMQSGPNCQNDSSFARAQNLTHAIELAIAMIEGAPSNKARIWQSQEVS